MRLLFNFMCFLVLCGCSIQELTETLNNPQKLLQNTEKEHKELTQINSKEYGAEIYNKFGIKQTLQIPTNCNDFITSFKSVNDEVYFSKKKIKNYNLADTFALVGGLATCQHYPVDDQFNQETAVEWTIKLYQAERNKNSWVIKAKKSIPNADNILVFASVMVSGYETQRFGGALSDLIYAVAKTNNDNVSSFDVNKNRLKINNINGTSTVYFKETIKNVWLIKALRTPDGEYIEDMAYMGLFLQPLLSTEAKLDFQRKMGKMQTRKTSTVNNTTPKVIEL